TANLAASQSFGRADPVHRHCRRGPAVTIGRLEMTDRTPTAAVQKQDAKSGPLRRTGKMPLSLPNPARGDKAQPHECPATARISVARSPIEGETRLVGCARSR